MTRERIPMKKIDNAAARQVTFAKRRRGLFKKAKELSVLCDADVAAIIFSSAGKLFEYSSSSMKDLLARHHLHPKNLDRLDLPSLELQLVENSSYTRLSREIADKSHRLRQMRGEELQGLSMEELQQLEKSLENGLGCVIEKKIGPNVCSCMNSGQSYHGRDRQTSGEGNTNGGRERETEATGHGDVW